MIVTSAQATEKISSLNEVQAITEMVHLSFSNCPDERTKFLFKNLIDHLHNFVRETSLTHEEWLASINFLDRFRQEDHYIMVLSDIFGVSTLVDMVSNKKPLNATENTILGPLYTENTQILKNGDSIASEGKGDYFYMSGRILDVQGNPIAGAIMDVWEADQHGVYDIEYPDYNDKPDCRGRFTTGEDGVFAFRAVKPLAYPFTDNGPAKDLLDALHSTKYRPAHLHFKIVAPDYMELVTQLYFKDDQYLEIDTAFAVRQSLIVDPKLITDTSITLARGFKEAKPHHELERDFVLVREQDLIKPTPKA
ncbi:intradiol ring-cleavage dioxygenase [Guyanagaster necrorhizus]|uniref:Intradiol ring-cleavage dioxygenase n=1 Tax=Guyanagaster necrorhizus TaxID=856835 RepID=A0A9P7VRC3_9AGAR|nr:intradiol ring-cleavage dioxygenase [Guyanagaster necrorhizus MCA 3950]KAG7444539.1 intradiol ring-cleavage dioxygenase [Guyanagaster necrorhizus MCA 3950]